MGQLTRGVRGRDYTRVKDAGSGTYGQYDILQDTRIDKKYYFRPTGSTNAREVVTVDFSRLSTRAIFDRCAGFDYDEQTILTRMMANENDLIAEMIYNYTVKLSERE